MGATQSLKVAIKENDLEGVVNAIKNGADLYAKDKNGRDWPAYARHKRRPDLAIYVELKQIMKRVADFNTVLSDGSTIMTQAAQWGLYPLIEELLTVYSDSVRVNGPDSSGSTPLIRACEFAQAKTMAILLKYGASPSICNKWMQSPLYYTVSTFHSLPTGGVAIDATVQALQASASTPKIGTSSNLTPVQSTKSLHRSEEDLLAKAGIDIDWATEYPVSALLSVGADANVATTTGVTPLMKAVADGAPLPVVQALLSARALVNIQNSTGDSPLTLAVERGRGDIVELLVASRAQLQLTDSEGNSPLATAVLRNHIGIMRTLLRARADPNSRSLNGSTPLILAAEAGASTEMFDLLLERENIQVNVRDNSGSTALAKAVERADFEVAQMLLDGGASLLQVSNENNPIGTTSTNDGQYALDPSLMSCLDEVGAVVVFYGPSAPRVPIPREIFLLTHDTPESLAFKESPVYRSLKDRGIDGQAQAYLWVPEGPHVSKLVHERYSDPVICAQRNDSLKRRRDKVTNSEVIRRVLRNDPENGASMPDADSNGEAAASPVDAPIIRITAAPRSSKNGKGAMSKKVGDLLGLHASSSGTPGFASANASGNDASFRNSQDGSVGSVDESRASGITPTTTYGFEFTDYDAIDTTSGSMVLGQFVPNSQAYSPTIKQASLSASDQKRNDEFTTPEYHPKQSRATSTSVMIPAAAKHKIGTASQQGDVSSPSRQLHLSQSARHIGSQYGSHQIPSLIVESEDREIRKSLPTDLTREQLGQELSPSSVAPKIPARIRRGSTSLSQAAMEAAKVANDRLIASSMTTGRCEENKSHVKTLAHIQRGRPFIELPVTPSKSEQGGHNTISTPSLLNLYSPSVASSHLSTSFSNDQQSPQRLFSEVATDKATPELSTQPFEDPISPPPPPPPLDPEDDPRLWRKAVDADTSLPYYYNVRTKHSTWQLPNCIQEIDRCAECECTTLVMDAKRVALCTKCQHWHG